MKKMNFSDIPAHCKYAAKHKATISTWHSKIIEWAVDHFGGTDNAKRKLIDAMNYITYCVVSGDSIPDVPIDKIIERAAIARSSDEEKTCGSMYIPYRDVIWDIEPVPTEDEVAAKPIDAAPAVPQIELSSGAELKTHGAYPGLASAEVNSGADLDMDSIVTSCVEFDVSSGAEAGMKSILSRSGCLCNT